MARYLKRTVIYAIAFYSVLCLAAFVFQRRLMYPASKLDSADPKAFGVPAQQGRNVPLPSGTETIGCWHVQPEPRTGSGGAVPGFDAALADAPLVTVFFHGNGGHRGYRADVLMALSAMDVHAVGIDYRSYGDSTGSPSEEGFAEDARAVWDWLTKAQGVEPGRIVLLGESLGCAVAIRLAQEQCRAGAAPAGLVLEAPFSSMLDAAANLYWFLPVRLMLWDTYPSLERIGSVTCPLLVLHGTDDRVVPFAQGKRIFEAAPAQSACGIPKRLVEFPGAGHIVRRTEASRYLEELGAFLGGLRGRQDTAATAGAPKQESAP
ncbi:MAG: alpha/beta hydrolase [Planctomycetes bacterium]|nr:alpha/beta hydrolase [Planctomycetota bacterium]